MLALQTTREEKKYLTKNEIVKKAQSDRLSPGELLSWGGQWLGTAREWIQQKFVNGDTVTWGSGDSLSGTFHVIDIELFAASIACSTLRQFVSNLSTDSEKRALKVYKNRENWSSHIKNAENGRLVVFRPENGLHFASPISYRGLASGGWEVAEEERD